MQSQAGFTAPVPGDREATQPAALLATLQACGVPVSTNAEQCRLAGTDWTGMYRGPVIAIVTPRDAAEVSVCLKSASDFGVPLQIQGGNTGLVAGSVPGQGRPALLLSTRAMTAMGAVDSSSRRVRVGAGVTCAALANAAHAAGLRFGVDLAARDSATVGGMVATNAGGINVCAYGMMRRQVRGLSAVLADGSLLDTMGRPDKDNTGYDLGGLLIGSEGTLGVVVAVEVQLHRSPATSSIAALGVADLATAIDLARRVADSGFLIMAAEVVDHFGVTRAGSLFDLRIPDRRAPWWLFLEVADGGAGAGLEALADLDPTVGVTSRDRAQLWALRERQTLVYSAMGARVAKFDVAVAPEQLDALSAGMTAAFEDIPGVSGVGMFGHVLDGNLHVQVWGPDPCSETVSRAALELVSRLGGSISAEHGIGRTKAAYLHLSRPQAQISAMRAIRRALDPRGLLNPGVLFDEAG